MCFWTKNSIIVIRISEVIMQKSDTNRASKVNHRQAQASTTLSRKYTKRPAKSTDVMVAVKRSPKIKRFSSQDMGAQGQAMQSAVQASQQTQVAQAQTAQAQGQRQTQVAQTQTTQVQKAQTQKTQAQKAQTTQAQTQTAQVAVHPLQETANKRMKERAMQTKATPAPKVSAKELKDQAIQKALAAAANTGGQASMAEVAGAKETKTKKIGGEFHFGLGRILLALSCAAVAVFAIVYFVNLNMPDISLRVAAMQTGMDPTYPNYVPRDYNVASISSEENKIAIDFKNDSTGESFSLTEEKSSWDTNALASNFVKSEYGENYTIVREQGLTIYVSGSNAAWVNGGIVYKIKADPGVLTNKQIRSIAVSL